MTITDPIPAPSSLHEEFAPASLSDFVGQDAAKMRLKVHIDSARDRGAPLPHILLHSDRGHGKTTLARLIAYEIGDPIVEVSEPCKPTEFVQALYEINGIGCVMVDEVHRWSKTQQRGLLTLLEEGHVNLTWGREEFPRVSVIAATTEIHLLETPFLSRFPIRPPFAPYSNDEMRRIVAGMAARGGVNLDSGALDVLAAACTGVPRSARDLIVAARDMAHSLGRAPTGEEILEFCQIEPDGLTTEHIAYLDTLAGSVNGQAGLKVLVTRLRLHESYITNEIERVLIDRGYVGLDTRGRVLTAKGRRRLAGDLD